MSTETFLIIRCDAYRYGTDCENSITTAFSNPPMARQWAYQEGWRRTRKRVRNKFHDLCPDHTHLAICASWDFDESPVFTRYEERQGPPLSSWSPEPWEL